MKKIDVLIFTHDFLLANKLAALFKQMHLHSIKVSNISLFHQLLHENSVLIIVFDKQQSLLQHFPIESHFLKKNIATILIPIDLQHRYDFMSYWQTLNEAQNSQLNKITLHKIFFSIEKAIQNYESEKNVSVAKSRESVCVKKVFDIFYANRNTAISIQYIAEQIFGDSEQSHINSIYAYIHYLRKSIKHYYPKAAQLVREKKGHYRLIAG